MPMSAPLHSDAHRQPRVVVDVGSNTIHAFTVEGKELKLPVRLGALVEGATPGQRQLSSPGIDALVEALQQVIAHFEVNQPEQVHAFATSAVRDSTNQGYIVEQVLHRTGVRLAVISGLDEAGLTYRWAADWLVQQHPTLTQARLGMVDIGGGSVELATGVGLQVEEAISLPLGTAWLTSTSDPEVEPQRAVQRWRDLIAQQWRRPDTITLAGRMVVGTSKTWATLGSLCSDNPDAAHVDRQRLGELLQAPDRILHLLQPLALSPGRAQQSLAGAVVAHALLEHFDGDRVVVCPSGALREAYMTYVLGVLATPTSQQQKAAGLMVAPKLGGDAPRFPSEHAPRYHAPRPGVTGDWVATCPYRPARYPCGAVHVQRLS